MCLKKQPLTPTSPWSFSLRSNQIILPTRRRPDGGSNAAHQAAVAAPANPEAEVPAEAENSERSGYGNSARESTRAVAGSDSAAVTLCFRAEDADGA